MSIVSCMYYSTRPTGIQWYHFRSNLSDEIIPLIFPRIHFFWYMTVWRPVKSASCKDKKSSRSIVSCLYICRPVGGFVSQLVVPYIALTEYTYSCTYIHTFVFRYYSVVGTYLEQTVEESFTSVQRIAKNLFCYIYTSSKMYCPYTLINVMKY